MQAHELTALRQMFPWFDIEKTERCSCGWSGTLRELGVSHMFPGEFPRALECPSCHAILVDCLTLLFLQKQISSHQRN